MSKLFLWILTFTCLYLQGCSKNIPEPNPSTKKVIKKENTWIFLMAGQSNMAGRGIIEAQDLLTNERIITINKIGEWIKAKEPLHFYEEGGLDCGMSFANELLEAIPDSITIAMVPCAVGGSSIFQWLNDEVHREVRLYSNFTEKVNLSKGKGIIKGILWHQGERNANSTDIPLYKETLETLFTKFRVTTGNPELPIILGELGRFAQPESKQEKFNQINGIIHLVADENTDTYYISSEGLTDKGDHLHFDSKSQRELGKRYAQKYYEVRLKNRF